MGWLSLKLWMNMITSPTPLNQSIEGLDARCQVVLLRYIVQVFAIRKTFPADRDIGFLVCRGRSFLPSSFVYIDHFVRGREFAL